jgi:hypothetical protein
MLYFKVLLVTRLEGLTKIKKSVSQDSRCSGPDSNRVPSEYKPNAELTRQYLVKTDINFLLFFNGAAAHIGPWPPLYEVP